MRRGARPAPPSGWLANSAGVAGAAWVIQLARPRWRVGVDVEPAMGAECRVRMLTMLEREGMLMGGVHVPWPGFGRIIRDGDGFLYVPRPQQFA